MSTSVKDKLGKMFTSPPSPSEIFVTKGIQVYCPKGTILGYTTDNVQASSWYDIKDYGIRNEKLLTFTFEDETYAVPAKYILPLGDSSVIDEFLRQKALAKLTDHEKKLLGLG